MLILLNGFFANPAEIDAQEEYEFVMVGHTGDGKS